MTRARTLFAAALALAAAGCIVVPDDHVVVAGGAAVVYEHDYIYYPSYGAYYCTVHDDWWCRDGGTWVRFDTRPSFIVLSADVAWISIADRGPEPFRHFDDHSRSFPRDWRPERPPGPPPGRGWRK